MKPKYTFLKIVFRQLLIISIIYCLILPTIAAQGIYYPIKDRLDVNLELKKKIHDIYFYSKDNVKLNAWYIKAQKNKPTIVFCHGNGGNISYYQDIIKPITDKGYGLFMLDYRGYGKSSGKPSEKGLYNDLNSAIAYLKTKENINENDIILWGLSLGGAVVAEIAFKSEFKGIIFQSTFTSVKDMAIYMINKAYNPDNTAWLKGFIQVFVDYMPINQNFDTKNKVQKIKSPVLIAHDLPDEVIPAKMSYELYKSKPSARFFISKTGSHNTNDWFKPRALAFIDSLH